MLGFLSGVIAGLFLYFVVRVLLAGFFTVQQNERAVLTSFGRAERIEGRTSLDMPAAEHLNAEQRDRYRYPLVRVVGPGGPYFKWPWQKVHKVDVAIQTVNAAYDPDAPTANYNNTMLDAVTKDQLNIGIRGQLRYRVSHSMSRSVREDVTPKAAAWGYEIGSIYIRKVHFRDHQMINQIEQKVVNRLRQVTSAILQAGDNRVNVIESTAEREAAVEFARAAAVRPQFVGEAFGAIAKDKDVVGALLRVLEINKLLETDGEITLIPGGEGATLLRDLVASR